MAPEPPIEPEGSPIRCQSDLNYGQNLNSEESDDEEMEIPLGNGYEPLSTNPEMASEPMEDESDEEEPVILPQREEPEPDLGLRLVVEEVWNQPRPNELNFELDDSKQELIKSTMRQLRLPKLDSAPDWMKNISDEELVSKAMNVIKRNQNTP